MGDDIRREPRIWYPVGHGIGNICKMSMGLEMIPYDFTLENVQISRDIIYNGIARCHTIWVGNFIPHTHTLFDTRVWTPIPTQ